MPLDDLALLLRKPLMLLEQGRRDPGVSEVLQKAEQAEQTDVVRLALQEPPEDHHVHRHLERSRMRRRLRFAHFREQKQRVRISNHAVGEAVQQPLHFAAIQACLAFLERLDQLRERAAGSRIQSACSFDFAPEVRLRLIAGVAADRERGRG